MTEKDYNPNMKENKAMKKQPKEKPKIAQAEKPKEKEQLSKSDQPKEEEKKKETKSDKKKQEVKKQEVPKKNEVITRGSSVPVSTKKAAAICKFIKGKKIEVAIADLEEVSKLKKAIPMKGEYPHQKGKGMMSGRFPKRAAAHFIVLVKNLLGNARNHGIEDPIIFEAIANQASKPFARFGRWSRKRTHITLKAKKIAKKKSGGQKK